jgi:hypothetical protein
MAEERINIDLKNKSEETFTTKLYSDQFNKLELEKSVNTKVTELIKPLPNAKLDLVPRPIYDAEVKINKELSLQIVDLNTKVEDLTTKLAQKTADSGSLYISNDFLKLQNANLENSLAAQNNIVAELRTGLSTAIQKAISENAERTGLEAENAGLVAQKTALLKQIDTLNNLVSAAQTTVAKTQEAVGPMNELKAGGGFAIGNLASILFDDLSFYRTSGRMFEINYSKSNRRGEIISGRGLDSFQIAAGAKDVTITISDADSDGKGQNNNIYTWTPGRSFDLKSGTTTRGNLGGNKLQPNETKTTQYDMITTFTATATGGETASVKINSRWFNK